VALTKECQQVVLPAEWLQAESYPKKPLKHQVDAPNPELDTVKLQAENRIP